MISRSFARPGCCGGDRAELGVHVVAGEQPCVEGMLELTEGRALCEPIDDDEVRAIEAVGVEFVLAREIGSERR